MAASWEQETCIVSIAVHATGKLLQPMIGRHEEVNLLFSFRTPIPLQPLPGSRFPSLVGVLLADLVNGTILTCVIEGYGRPRSVMSATAGL